MPTRPIAKPEISSAYLCSDQLSSARPEIVHSVGVGGFESLCVIGSEASDDDSFS